MFVPLVEYHGGGAAATFEPLSEHLPDLEWHLAQNFGSGVQARPSITWFAVGE